ncbi:MAG: alpha/beta hydrolase [Erysipelotrichaceae bacterium]|nr:alpha/beta hydrolase [Erysipelotrichaceae bacterium]
MGYNETMKMNYIKFGNGPRTMLILPGLSVRPVCPLADSIVVAYDVFSKDFTVYLFDRREDIPENYSLEQMADDTVTKIKELDLKDIYLYGVSQGGMIAQIITLKYPELVKKLALASTCSYVEDGTVNKWAEASGKHDLEGLLKSFVTKVYGDAYYEQYKDVIYAAYGDLTEEEMDYFAILASAVNGFDIRKEADKITVPVFVTGSKDDNVIPIALMEESAGLLKAESYFFEGYSHAVYDEAEELKTRVFDFFMK